MEPAPERFILCPRCQTENLSDRPTCLECGGPLEAASAPGNPWEAPSDASLPPGKFHIGTLMLVIALIAVCLGITIEMPGIGVVLLLLALPATIRSTQVAHRRRKRGRPLNWPDYMMVFVASVGVVMAIELGSIIGFVATCLPTGFVLAGGGFWGGIVVAFAVGLGVAGYVGFFLTRRLWPQE